MKKYGLPVEEGFIQELDYENTETDMHDVIKEMVSSPISIEGIIFATHYLTAYGLRELKRLNIQVPTDVAIVSYGQMSDFDLIEPPVTSVLLPSSEIGDMAVDILLRNMKETTLNYENVSLKTKLVVRKSCGMR
jgi:LacI family transcriptional regulator